jgi:hypothetical protein
MKAQLVWIEIDWVKQCCIRIDCRSKKHEHGYIGHPFLEDWSEVRDLI